MDKKEMFEMVVQQYNHVRNHRHLLMEKTNMDKFANGFYAKEIEAVKFAYELLGFHEVSIEEDGELHVLVPDDGDPNFTIATDDFIVLMENSSDLDLQDCIWDAFGNRNEQALSDLEDWFS